MTLCHIGPSMVLIGSFCAFDVLELVQGQNQEIPAQDFPEYFQTDPKAPSENSYSKVPTTGSSIVFFTVRAPYPSHHENSSS